MPLTWAEFLARITDRRFVLPIHEFCYEVRYVPISPKEAHLHELADLISGAVVATLRGRPGAELSALSLGPAVPQDRGEPAGSEAQETAFFTVLYGGPVYDFLVQMGPTTFRVSKQRTTLSELVNTVPIMEEISRRVMPHAAAAAGDTPPSCLETLLANRFHRVIFSFRHSLTLGAHLSQHSQEATNTEILERLLRLSPAAGATNQDHSAPLWALGAEGIRRGGVKLSMVRSFNGRKRSIWIDYTGWYNITMKDFDIDVQYRCDDPVAPVHGAELLDWNTPFQDFYLELVLNNLMPNLFFDVAVQPKMNL